jgi:uncharacterized protein with NRDE domain
MVSYYSMDYNNLYTGDNGASERMGKKYLDERRTIYRQVATSYFEVDSFLKLDGRWQKPEKIRISLSLDVSKHVRKAIGETINYFLKDIDKSTEGKKDKYGFLLSLPSTFASRSKIVCLIFDKLPFHFLKLE